MLANHSQSVILSTNECAPLFQKVPKEFQKFSHADWSGAKANCLHKRGNMASSTESKVCVIFALFFILSS
jgi:hypothetical protein